MCYGKLVFLKATVVYSCGCILREMMHGNACPLFCIRSNSGDFITAIIHHRFEGKTYNRHSYIQITLGNSLMDREAMAL